MEEQEIREPYEQPELIKLGSIKEITFDVPCYTCSGNFTI